MHMYISFTVVDIELRKTAKCRFFYYQINNNP
jgi:hypothetical protein